METITSPPQPIGELRRSLVQETVEKLISEAPDVAFTGLQTKVGVRVATAASYERTRKDGGTADAIAEIVSEAAIGRRCYTVDLITGEPDGSKTLEECTPGEYIFWRCLEEVLATDPEELRKVYLLMVREPGKARAVTKGLAALKVVLDLVNGVTSWSLGKAFPSSASGMLKESHGWNFFKEMFSHEDITFHVNHMEREPVAVGMFIDRITYDDLWLASTDFETATDFMLHEIGREVGRLWMTKCGIPPVLRGIVEGICYQPRPVEFMGEGPLARFGEPVNGKDGVRRVVLVRGVLMGDPLTKVVLHLINMGVRRLARDIYDGTSYTLGGFPMKGGPG